MLENLFNNVILKYSNNQYDFESLSEATKGDLVEVPYLAGLIRQITTVIVKEKRFRNKFAQFKVRRDYSGKIKNSLYVNPAKGEQVVDNLTALFDIASPDVKASVSKYQKPLRYKVSYKDEEIKNAFNSIEDLRIFIEKVINSLYNGQEIDDKNEFISLINDVVNNNYAVNTTPATVTSDSVKDLGICLKKIVLDLQEESDKFNVWKRLNPHDTSAIFWSNLEDICILVSNDVYATLDVGLYATLFNVDRADLKTRIYTVEASRLPEHLLAVVFDRQLIDIDEVFNKLGGFYDPSTMIQREFLNINNQYGVNPFANCVAVWDSSSNYPDIKLKTVRNQTVNVESGVKKTIILDVTPLGANEVPTPTSAGITATTTTAVVHYDPEKGYTMDITATADDSITFTGSGTITGTITVDVA